MKLLTNPVALQLIGLGVFLAGLFVVSLLVIRAMRKQMLSQGSLTSSAPRVETTRFESAAYQGVIADLKKREVALQVQLVTESRRFMALEKFLKSVLENIGTGVMLFTPALIVQQANPAAKKLLGYASPLNMHVKEIFRGLETIELTSSDGAIDGISQAIRDVCSAGADYRDVSATFQAPDGDTRKLKLTLLPYRDGSQQLIGAFCFLEEIGQEFTLSLLAQQPARTDSEPE